MDRREDSHFAKTTRNQRRLEYDFIVSPGAKPSAIRLAFRGASSIRVDAGGDLLLKVRGTEIRQRKPLLYQGKEGNRGEIAWGLHTSPEA
jgi:hypothetical protein